MVVENLIKPEWVEEKPVYAIILGLCLSTIGIWIGALLFPEEASLAGVLFTTLAGVPFLRKILKIEENIDSTLGTLGQFFQRNRHMLSIYLYFFIGMVISYSLWFMWGFIEQLYDFSPRVISDVFPK